jgi:rod shape-determining protein MreC
LAAGFTKRWRWIMVPIFLVLIFWFLATMPETWRHIAESKAGPLAGTIVKAPSRVSGVVRQFKGELENLWKVNRENQEFKNEISLLKIELAALKEVLKNEKALKKGLGYKEKNLRRVIPALVLARDPSTWFKYISLDKGTRDGIVEGSGVFNHFGVVGKVIRVNEIFSKAVFLVDDSCRLAVRVKRSGVLCVARGEGVKYCYLEYLSGADDVQVGDVIETAPGSLSFPEGVPLGKVIQIRKTDGGMNLFALVQPFADLKKPGALFIVRK